MRHAEGGIMKALLLALLLSEGRPIEVPAFTVLIIRF
jgi:hypothetical protein